MAGDQHAVLRTLLGPFAAALAEPGVNEIVVNRPGELWIEGSTGWRVETDARLTFAHLVQLAKVVASTSNQRIGDQHPLLSATLPDGERVQIVLPPSVAAGTASVTIRSPSSATFGLKDLDAGGLFAKVDRTSVRVSAADDVLAKLYAAGQWAAFLEAAVVARKNIIISGATGSGKTTLSKALIEKIPDRSKNDHQTPHHIIIIDKNLTSPADCLRANLLDFGSAAAGYCRYSAS